MYLHNLKQNYVYVQANKVSSTILQQWERENAVLVTSKTLKAPQLDKAIRMCGLGTSNLTNPKRRILLASLRTHELPREPVKVNDELVKKYNLPISGSCVHDFIWD